MLVAALLFMALLPARRRLANAAHDETSRSTRQTNITTRTATITLVEATGTAKAAAPA
jgi:hypothetical protein